MKNNVLTLLKPTPSRVCDAHAANSSSSMLIYSASATMIPDNLLKLVLHELGALCTKTQQFFFPIQ